mgnify:CR=1 FL=1
MEFDKRMDFLRQNPRVSDIQLSDTEKFRNYRVNCHGTSLYLKSLDWELKEWENTVVLKRGFPGFVHLIAIQYFLENSEYFQEVYEKERMDKGDLITFSFEKMLCHSGILISKDKIFHLWQPEKKFREDNIEEVLNEHDKKYYKSIKRD